MGRGLLTGTLYVLLFWLGVWCIKRGQLPFFWLFCSLNIAQQGILLRKAKGTKPLRSWLWSLPVFFGLLMLSLQSGFWELMAKLGMEEGEPFRSGHMAGILIALLLYAVVGLLGLFVAVVLSLLENRHTSGDRDEKGE